MASAGYDATVKLWDAAGGQELRTLSGHAGGVAGVTFSPDGRRLASASGDQTVKIWDVPGGQNILTLNGHTDGVTCAVFSPDGLRLASASFDRTIKIWDATSGHEIRTLRGHTEFVAGVVFSADGQQLASGSRDHMVKVWDAATGRELPDIARTFGRGRGPRLQSRRPASRLRQPGQNDQDLGRGHGAGSPYPLRKQKRSRQCGVQSRRPRLASADYDQRLRVWEATPLTEDVRLEREAKNLVPFLAAHQNGVDGELEFPISQGEALKAVLSRE